MLDEDGSAIVSDILEAIIDDNEKVGVIMILKAGEEWSPGDTLSYFRLCAVAFHCSFVVKLPLFFHFLIVYCLLC